VIAGGTNVANRPSSFPDIGFTTMGNGNGASVALRALYEASRVSRV
jgi:hypothetical protein